jgi:hypothetical protein
LIVNSYFGISVFSMGVCRFIQGWPARRPGNLRLSLIL